MAFLPGSSEIIGHIKQAVYVIASRLFSFLFVCVCDPFYRFICVCSGVLAFRLNLVLFRVYAYLVLLTIRSQILSTKEICSLIRKKDFSVGMLL